ncbi:MAG: hypothetical protein CMJ67_05850 [Planctomycetaceae bacterium]|nr:hypothetical protein [Planctomycetaceae bacterium]
MIQPGFRIDRDILSKLMEHSFLIRLPTILRSLTPDIIFRRPAILAKTPSSPASSWFLEVMQIFR